MFNLYTKYKKQAEKQAVRVYFMPLISSNEIIRAIFYATCPFFETNVYVSTGKKTFPDLKKHVHYNSNFETLHFPKGPYSPKLCFRTELAMITRRV